MRIARFPALLIAMLFLVVACEPPRVSPSAAPPAPAATPSPQNTLQPLDPSTPLSMLSSTAVSDFPKSIELNATFSTGAPVSELLLRYIAGRTGSQVYARPEMTTEEGSTVRAHYSLRMINQSPGLPLVYWYEVKNARGDMLETPRTPFTYLDSRFTWTDITQGTLTLSYQGNTRDTAQRVLKVGRDEYARMSALLGISSPPAWRIFVYENLAAMNQAMPVRSQHMSASYQFGGWANLDSASIMLGGYVAEDTHSIAHEIAHLLIYEASSLRDSVPSWLNEGLAEVLSGNADAREDSDLARFLRSDSLLALSTMHELPASSDQVDLFYMESRSMARFLVEQLGWEKVQVVLRELGKPGVTVDQALVRAYGFDRAGLEQVWRARIAATR